MPVIDAIEACMQTGIAREQCEALEIAAQARVEAAQGYCQTLFIKADLRRECNIYCGMQSKDPVFSCVTGLSGMVRQRELANQHQTNQTITLIAVLIAVVVGAWLGSRAMRRN